MSANPTGNKRKTSPFPRLAGARTARSSKTSHQMLNSKKGIIHTPPSATISNKVFDGTCRTNILLSHPKHDTKPSVFFPRSPLSSHSMIARQTIYEGRVQGVGFRYSCKDLAKGFDLTGYVENLPDGTVKLILQGEPEEIEEYLHELSEESALSHHIKGQMTTPIELDPTIRGFSISK